MATYCIKIQTIYSWSSRRNARRPVNNKTTHEAVYNRLKEVFGHRLNLGLFADFGDVTITGFDWQKLFHIMNDFPQLFFTIEEAFTPTVINIYYYYKKELVSTKLKLVKPRPPRRLINK